MNKRNSRRSVLAGISGGCLVTAGCISRLTNISETGFKLGEFWLINLADDERTVAIRLEHEDESYIEDEIIIPSKDTKFLPRSWPTEAVNYTLSFSLVGYGNDEQVFELTADQDTSSEDDCMFLRIHIDPLHDLAELSMSPASDHPWGPGC